MTAIATASTKNWTNLMISRVNRKKMATIPTIPRNSGPNSPCREVTRPVVLGATGDVVMIRWGIVLARGVMGAGGWGGASGCRGTSPGLLSLASWLLGGRAYGRDVPRPVLSHDGHLVGHRQ